MMCVFMCDADSYSSEVVGHILARYDNTVNLKPQFVVVPAVVTNDWSSWEEMRAADMPRLRGRLCSHPSV